MTDRATAPTHEDTDEAIIYATPARAVPVRAADVAELVYERADGGPLRGMDALMQRAKDRAMDPTVFDDSPPYFFRAIISNSELDAYSTIMEDSTLRNYASDAEVGVPFQNSHNVRSLPFGASLTGKFTNGRNGEPGRTEADFYTIPGLKLNEAGTDDLIRGLRSGILREVSVGFTGGETICSICGRDMGDISWLWDDSRTDYCWHYPGETYPVLDKNGKATGETQVAVGRIQNAHLLEVSAVYRGATPGAAVVKAQRAADAGKLPPALARRLEDRFRIKIPSRRTWAVDPGRDARDAHDKKEQTMPEGTTERQDTISGDTGTFLTPAVREILARAGFAPAADNAAALETSVRSASEELVRLRARETELAPLADDGKRYRAELIENALSEGRRAHGADFTEETYRTMLDTAPLDTIRAITGTFKKLADAVAGTPGARVDATVTEDTGDKPHTSQGLPSAAYRNR